MEASLSASNNTSSSSWQKIKVPAQGRIKGFVTIKPDYIDLGDIKTGEQVTSSVLLVSSSPIDSIVSCKTTADNIKPGDIRFLTKNKIRIYIQSVSNPKNKEINCEVKVTVLCKGKSKEAVAVVNGRYKD